MRGGTGGEEIGREVSKATTVDPVLISKAPPEGNGFKTNFDDACLVAGVRKLD